VHEELHGPFMLFGGFAGVERAQVAAFAGLRVCLPRIEKILARLEFADYESPPSTGFLLELGASPMPPVPREVNCGLFHAL
jgi:hypothetical protein